MIRRVLFWLGMVAMFMVGCLVITFVLAALLGSGVTAVGTIIRMLAGAVWGIIILGIGFEAWDRWVR